MRDVNIRSWITGAVLSVLALGAPAAPLPLFDAHIHYSEDAWTVVAAEAAIERLRKAGITRVFVSSSGDDGTQRLYAAAPDFVIPALRPYRKRGEQVVWARDESIVVHVEQRLKKYRYAAIGEFHVYGKEADLPVVRRMVDLAKQHNLLLHVHSDADAIDRIFAHDPQARVVWAHAGFEEPARVRQAMSAHKNLWADLSIRSDVADGAKVAGNWRKLFLDFPDRFMVGTDTYSPERWSDVAAHADWVRTWLADLPPSVAERIAHKNGEAVIAAAFR